jgi:hypothetical protein
MRKPVRGRRAAVGDRKTNTPSAAMCVMLASGLTWLMLSATAEAGIRFEVPLGKHGLPATFAGEALTVALAFAFPALAAGAYLGARRVLSRFGRRSVWIVASATAMIIGAMVLADQRPDLMDLAALKNLTGL